MKKVFNWILIGTLVIILFIAAVTTYDALTKRKERKIAEANAISYIEKKYGFTPTIIDSDKYYDSSFNFDIVISYSKKSTDYYRINMEHDDKSFTVYSPYTDDSIGTIDNYQNDEIDTAIGNKVSEFLGKDSSCFLETTIYADRGLGTSTFFDGSNLKEMLSEYEYSRVMVHTAGLDAASIDINKLKESIGCTQLYILDYTSAEVYNETKEFYLMETAQASTWGKDPKDCVLLLPFIDECYYIRSAEEPSYIKSSLKSVDGILYGTYKDLDITASRCDKSFPLTNWDRSNSADNNYRQKTNFYELNSGSNVVYIYVPYGDFGMENRYKAGCFVAKEYKSGKTSYKRSDFYSIFGVISKTYPYSVFKVYIKDIGSDVRPKNVYFTITGTDQ